MRQLLIVIIIVASALGVTFTTTAQSSSPAAGVPKASSLHTGWLFTAPEAVASDYTSFCQDPSGFLWVGTDRGLLRFEGNSYDTYSSNPSAKGSISDNRILALLCDSKGRVWVATANGLNRYDAMTDTFEVIELPTLDFYGYIIDVAELADGTVVFIVSGVGLFFISEESGSPVAVRFLPNLQEEKNFNSLLCTPDGRLYVGTRNGQLCVIEPNGRSHLISVTDNYVAALASDIGGDILVADVNRIFRVAVKNEELITPLLSSRNIHISNLANNVNGDVYVATQGTGLWRVVGNSDNVEYVSDLYSPFLSLSSANIGAVYCSPDGNIWLGCNYYGLIMIPSHPLPFTYRKLSDIFPDFSGGINAVTTWGDNVVLALDKERVAVLSPEGYLLKTIQLPGKGSLNSLTMLGQDRLIVGMANDGVYEVTLTDGRVKRLLEVDATFPNIHVAPGLGDELFVAIHGVGVMRFNPKTGERSYLPIDGEGDRLTNSYVASMYRSSDDKIWMGLFGGLACFDLKGDSLVAIDQTPFLSGAAYSLAETSGANVVLGTSQGLILLDSDNRVKRKFTTSDGLVSNDIRDLATDPKGGLWVATLHGLSYMNPLDSTFISFHGGYGLVENAFGHLAPTSSGRGLYTGSNLGVTYFTPDSVLSPGFGAKINISGVYLNGRRLSPMEKLDGRPLMEGNPMHPEALYLPYNVNALTLRLTTMDFRDGSNVSYRWRLDGYSKEWNFTAPGDVLIYLPHLDPGKYTLHIQAMENGLLSEPLVTIIHISTPWYLSWWAKTIYGVLLLCVLGMCYWMLKKHRQSKEDADRIKFFMDISHDIRSPITLIMSPLESLMKEPFNNDVKMKLNTMHRNSQRILSLVNQLLEIRKLEKGKVRLACRLTDLNVFVSELVDMFKPQAQEKGQTLTFEECEDLPKIWVDRTNFDKILVNLISNAIKYTPDGGSIVVRNTLGDDAELGEVVEVSIIDSGVGLDSKTEQRLFERFYQGDASERTNRGFGIGLDLCRRLVEFHHGRISGHNRSDGVKGSIFTVALPVDPDIYSFEEKVYSAPAVTEGEGAATRDFLLPSMPVGDNGPVRQPRSSGQKSILVVDDDKELREYISAYFRKHFKVKVAADGAEALRIIADSLPDLIISDVMMPGVDGLTMLQRLKKNADTHHIPIVLLSSKQDIADRMAGWDRGADGYIGKPFHIEELEALVDNLIDNRLRMKGKFSGSQDTEGKIAPPEMKGNDEALMERVMKIIDINIEDPKLNVEKLAVEVGLSRAHLHRKMKDMVGMTPSDFIRTIRMRRACELLRKGDVAVTQVAYKVGFTSQPHFSTIFKSFTGFTPSEYRDKSESGELPGDNQ